MPIPDTDLDMIPLPASCLACGAIDKQAGDACPRCGLTDADARTLLRAAASAYNSARAEAMAGRFDMAQTLLEEARGLGIPEHPSVVQLQFFLKQMNFPMTENKMADDYWRARTTALQGRFSDAQRLSLGILSPSPFVGELQRLSVAGAKQERKVKSRQVIMGSVAGIAITGLFAAGIYWRQPTPVPLAVVSPVPSPAFSPTVVVSPSPAITPTQPTPEPTEYPYPERLARRYFNDALDARKKRDYAVAARLAEAAAETGRNTYILPHALLLRAEIADTIREEDAYLRWSEIAKKAPDSPYAALGLLRAAERVQNITGDPSRSAPFLMELYHHYGTSYEARQAKKIFNFPVTRTP